MKLSRYKAQQQEHSAKTGTFAQKRAFSFSAFPGDLKALPHLDILEITIEVILEASGAAETLKLRSVPNFDSAFYPLSS